MSLRESASDRSNPCNLKSHRLLRLLALSRKDVVIFFAALFIPISAYAWSARGHVLIAEMAYLKLPQIEQQQLNKQASVITQQLSRWQQKKLIRQFRTAAPYARLAGLPDQWRGLTLKHIFEKFNAPIPNSLKKYQNQTTNHWHYYNKAVGYSYCHTVEKPNVISIIPKLETAYQETTNPNSRAVLLVFLTHLIGDAYQPLHVITKVNFACSGDAGGNGYCLKSSRNGKCQYSLHKLWDGGVGFFRGYLNYNNMAAQLNQQPVQKMNLEQQVARSVNLSNFIYDTPRNRMPSERYYRHAQLIVKNQLRASALLLRSSV